MLKWSVQGSRLARKIGFIIGIICHLHNKQECNLPLLVVRGENEDVNIGLLSSVMYELQMIPASQCTQRAPSLCVTTLQCVGTAGSSCDCGGV